MKFPFFPKTKFSRTILGILVLASFFGCQKDSLETWNSYAPDSQSTALVSAEVSNFLVITKSETLPDGFETQFSAYGEIVRSMPEIGEIVIKPKVSGFERKVSKLANVLAVVPDIVVRWIEPVELSGEANPSS